VLSRRTAGSLIAAGVSALMIGAAWRHRHPAPLPPPPTSGPTGALDDATLAVLMGAARALIGMEKLDGPYADYYAYQARNRPGYLGAYQAFAAAISGQMETGTHEGFATLPVAQRLSILDAVSRASDGRFDIPILQETLGIFMKTDAWVLLGHDGWPGSPRGLESYRRPFKAGALS
jgi:hypothetical protein